jgi:hypothetical protein
MNDEELTAWREQELAELRQFTYHQSRIPALDALVTFVPEGQEHDPVIVEAVRRKGLSRWYPVPGGHRLLILHEREPYDEKRFTVEKGIWNHEHCKRCVATIPSMTLCWVSNTRAPQPYIILCAECYGDVKPE